MQTRYVGLNRIFVKQVRRCPSNVSSNLFFFNQNTAATKQQPDLVQEKFNEFRNGPFAKAMGTLDSILAIPNCTETDGIVPYPGLFIPDVHIFQ